MPNIQQITYMTKVGESHSQTLEIVEKKSKKFIVRHPGERNTFEIASKNIVKITDPVKEEVQK